MTGSLSDSLSKVYRFLPPGTRPRGLPGFTFGAASAAQRLAIAHVIALVIRRHLATSVGRVERRSPERPSYIRALWKNSLRMRTGKLFELYRELNRAIREVSDRIREYELLARVLPERSEGAKPAALASVRPETLSF